jgi:signal transduction histidine kinase
MASVQRMNSQGRVGHSSKIDTLIQWHDIALVLAGATVVLGFAVLLGWGLRMTALTSVLPGAVPMWPATALLVIVSGVALGLASRPRLPRITSNIPAAFVIAVAGVIFIDHLTGYTLGYPNFLFAQQVQATGMTFAGRPAFLTVVGLLLLNGSLLLMNARRHILSQQLASLGLLLAWIATTGYIFSTPNLYGSPVNGYLAVNTAIAFLLLGAGLFAAQPDAGVMHIFTRDSLSRPALFRLWLSAIIFTFVMGWISSLIQARSGAPPAQVLALFVASIVVIITVLTGWSAVALQKLELERQRALSRMVVSQDYLRHLQAITSTLSGMTTVSEVAGAIAQQGRTALGAQAAIAALVNDGNKSLSIVHHIGYPAEIIEPWRQLPMSDKSPMRDVIARKELMLIESREQAAFLYPHLASEQAQHQSWAVMPLIYDSKIVGAVDFAFTERRQFSLEDRSFLLSLAEQCAQALSRARLHEAKQQSARAASILATISQALTRAHSLDERVDALIHLIVPELADWCTLNVLDPTGDVRLIGVAHTEPGKADWIRAWAARHPLHINSSERLHGVLTSRRITHYDHIDEEIERQVAGDDPDALRWFRESNTGSMVEVALDSHNKTFGMLKLVRATNRPPFTPADVALIQDVAQQAAWALDNAMLFQSAMAASRSAERNAERTQRLQTVTALMNKARTVQQVTELMVTQGIEAMGARAGFITLLDEQDGMVDPNWLCIVAQRGYEVSEGEIPPLPQTRFPVSVSTPVNLAIQQGAPVWVESVAALFERFPAAARMLAQRDQAWACVPLIYEQTILGGLALSFEQPQEFEAEDKAMFIALARQCAQALERARLLTTEQKLNAELKGALDRVVHDEHVQRLLAQAGEVLSAPLDVRQRLNSAARLFVERMADWCTIEIMDAHGALSQQAVAHADFTKMPALLRLRNEFPLVTDGHIGVSKVMMTHEPVLYATIDEGTLKAMARNDEHLALFRELGCASGMMLPLCANGKLLGTISFIRCDDSPAYTQNDLTVASDLAARIGMAIENAMLFEESRALNQHLEKRVAERTAELEQSNDQLRESREQLRALSRQTMTMVEKERAQVVREVHDELGQSLASVKMSLAHAQKQLEKTSTNKAGDSIKAALASIDETIQSIRNLAANLRPVVLDDLGLVAAIEWQVREFEHKTGIYCDFSSDVDAGASLSHEVSTAAFRILQEALSNVSRHALASEVWVTLVANPSGMMLSIRDNGQGMRVVEPAKTYGLLSMHERALQLNGQLDIQSAPNNGTSIVLTLPLQHEMQKQPL